MVCSGAGNSEVSARSIKANKATMWRGVMARLGKRSHKLSSTLGRTISLTEDRVFCYTAFKILQTIENDVMLLDRFVLAG